MSITPSQPAARTSEPSPSEVFSAASEAQVCRIVLGLKVHGLEGRLQGLRSPTDSQGSTTVTHLAYVPAGWQALPYTLGGI